MMLGGLLDRHQRSRGMNTIEKLVVKFEEKNENEPHFINKQLAYRDFLIVYSFFLGASLTAFGNGSALGLIILIIIGIVSFKYLPNYFHKETKSTLATWLEKKYDFVNSEITISQEFENFRNLNPKYNAIDDLNVFLIKKQPRNLTISQLSEINTLIIRSMPHLEKITINENENENENENDNNSVYDDESNDSDDGELIYSSDSYIENYKSENNTINKSSNYTPTIEDEENIDISSINAKSFLNLSIEYLNNSLKHCKITSHKNQLKLLREKVKSIATKDLIAFREFYAVYKEIEIFRNEIDPYECEILWTHVATALVILDSVRDETFEFSNEIHVFMDTCENLIKKKK
jgi:hypothetical protein